MKFSVGVEGYFDSTYKLSCWKVLSYNFSTYCRWLEMVFVFLFNDRLISDRNAEEIVISICYPQSSENSSMRKRV